MAVQFRERHLLMHFRNHCFRAAVPVSVNRQNFFAPFQKHIVHAPGVDGQRSKVRKLSLRLGNSDFHGTDQRFQIPHKMSILFRHTVGEPRDLPCADFAILHPAHNMPPGGGTDVDCQMIRCHIHPAFPWKHHTMQKSEILHRIFQILYPILIKLDRKMRHRVL